MNEAFNTAVKMIRNGASTLAVCDALERDHLGMDILVIRDVASEARKYVEAVQTESFNCAVAAFLQGQTRLEIEKKLQTLGFHPYDAQTLAGRAQQKAQTTDALESEVVDHRE